MGLGLGLDLGIGSIATQRRRSPQQVVTSAIASLRAIHAFPKGSEVAVELEPYALYRVVDGGPLFLDALQIPADEISRESPGFTTFRLDAFSRVVQIGRAFTPNQAYGNLLPRLGSHVIRLIDLTQKVASDAETQPSHIVAVNEIEGVENTQAEINVDPKGSE